LLPPTQEERRRIRVEIEFMSERCGCKLSDCFFLAFLLDGFEGQRRGDSDSESLTATVREISKKAGISIAS
jgi:hypothetical protein